MASFLFALKGRNGGRLTFVNQLNECCWLFGVDHKPEQLALYQRAAKAARDARRLLAAATNVTDNERTGISTDIGYTFLECGYNSRNAGDAAAGETFLREGVDFVAGVVAKADSAKSPGLAQLLSHLHYDLGVTLTDMKRPDEARQQIVASEGLLEKAVQTPFAAEFRGKLENLRKRLENQ